MDLTHATEWVARRVDAGAYPNAVLGIADSSGIVSIEAFGGASADDHFPLFSITKPIVALAALRLIEEGKLAGGTPLTDAVPEFTGVRPDPVVLDHLVSHTAGMVEPGLDAPLRDSLLAPGRRFIAGKITAYSSIAYEGVAALIEHAGGSPWADQTLTNIARSGAEGFTFDAESSRHVPAGLQAHPFDWERFITLAHPGAGLFGRAADLLAVGSALLRDDGTLVQPVTNEWMRRPRTTGLPRLEPFTEDRPVEWGFSWNLPRDPALLTADSFGHGGWNGTQFMVTPSRDRCLVLLTSVIAPPGQHNPDLTGLINAVNAA
ncbi:MAG TPA: serine hydrolase domain-containing protein [Candidatus Lumbricidophila sp.]|nr:serine hydrolase domain-containing protein [Candidatus Lumbricidophila sp.]